MTDRASWGFVVAFVLSSLFGSTASAEEEPPAATEPAKEAPVVEATPPATPTPLFRSRWQTTLYGFVELDVVSDSTQSFAEASLNNPVAPRGTYMGDYGQTQATAKNSRLGLRIEPPDFAGMTSYAQVDFDFFGMAPTDATQNDYYVMGPMRLRHAFVVLRTPWVDFTAGQFPNLFGWGGAGFSPSTVAFLGVVGQVYHRDTQLRLAHTFGRNAGAGIEIAAAAVRPGQKQARLPDVEGGVRVVVNRWKGPSTQGNSQPDLVPLSLGVSGMGRFFAQPEYKELPRRPIYGTGWGVAINAVVPVIRANSISDRGNSITLTGEYSMGTGIADRYAALTGGARFQALPNPRGLARAPQYQPDVDAGLVTFDADDNLKTINWQGFVVGAQYYLPILSGRVWVTGTFSRIKSDNIAALTPVPNWGNIFTMSQYYDGNLFAAITPAIQLGLSFQVTETTRADGGVPRNLRGHGAVNFFF